MFCAGNPHDIQGFRIMNNFILIGSQSRCVVQNRAIMRCTLFVLWKLLKMPLTRHYTNRLLLPHAPLLRAYLTKKFDNADALYSKASAID